MKTIVAIMKHVFVPISAFLFLGIGILACIYSGVIEYSVLKEMLKVSGSAGEMIRPEFWPFILVVVLEGAKFTLHFYGASLKNKKTTVQITDMDAEGLCRLITIIKRSLVGFSLLCTVIFVTHTYYQDEGVSVRQQEEQMRIQASQEYDSGVDRLERARKKSIQTGLERYENDKKYIEELRDQLEEQERIIQNTAGIKHRDDLQEEADQTRKTIKEAEKRYKENTDPIYEKAQEEYDNSLKKLQETYGEEGSSIVLAKEDPRLAAAGDNPYLRVFLNAFCETLFGKSYGRKTYLVWVSVLAVLLAAILEACISISQTLLTISADSFLKILGECQITKEERRVVKAVAWLIFSIFSLVSSYIVCGLMLDVDLTRTSLMMAAGSYVMVILLMGISDRMGNGPSKDKKDTEGDMPLWKQLAQIAWSSVVPAAMAFAGYVFVGFICDGSFSYGDMNGLAIALGGVFARFIRRDICIA